MNCNFPAFKPLPKLHPFLLFVEVDVWIKLRPVSQLRRVWGRKVSQTNEFESLWDFFIR